MGMGRQARTALDTLQLTPMHQVYGVVISSLSLTSKVTRLVVIRRVIIHGGKYRIRIGRLGLSARSLLLAGTGECPSGAPPVDSLARRILLFARDVPPEGWHGRETGNKDTDDLLCRPIIIVSVGHQVVADQY